MSNISTTKLSKLAGATASFRLGASDRGFLADLSKVRIIDLEDANKWHYSDRKAGAKKRLDNLVKAGLLNAREIIQPGKGKVRTYEFSNDRVAKAFGGAKPVIGAKRSALHEVITSKIYFAEGRPVTFKIASDFTKTDIRNFKLAVGGDAVIPDAMYTDASNDIVLVEADSGNYTKSQILEKQSAWSGVKQVWGQPNKASARIGGNTNVYRFA